MVVASADDCTIDRTDAVEAPAAIDTDEAGKIRMDNVKVGHPQQDCAEHSDARSVELASADRQLQGLTSVAELQVAVSESESV